MPRPQYGPAGTAHIQGDNLPAERDTVLGQPDSVRPSTRHQQAGKSLVRTDRKNRLEGQSQQVAARLTWDAVHDVSLPLSEGQKVRLLATALEDATGIKVHLPTFYQRMLRPIAEAPYIDLGFAVHEYLQVFGKELAEAENPIGWFYQTFPDFLDLLVRADEARLGFHERHAATRQRLYDLGLDVLDRLAQIVQDRADGIRSGVYLPRIFEDLCALGLMLPVSDRYGYQYQYRLGERVRTETEWVKHYGLSTNIVALHDTVEAHIQTGLDQAPGTWHKAMKPASTRGAR